MQLINRECRMHQVVNACCAQHQPSPLQGMFDAQLEHVTRVLQKQRIWAINVGENFRISGKAWHAFCNALPDTRVGFMYVSEHHLMGSNLKLRMRDHIRANRK
jgi:hypothetical protein